jgi:hypothetical protein
MPFHWSRMVSLMSAHPARLERASSEPVCTMLRNLPTGPGGPARDSPQSRRRSVSRKRRPRAM